jgi:UDP-glucose 4-epimerase
MRILVTGGAGYVGSVSVEALVAAGHDVTIVDDLSTGHQAAVVDGADLVDGPYTDAESMARLLEARQIDAVLHCAARSLVGESIRDPARYFVENVAGGIGLLEAMR